MVAVKNGRFSQEMHFNLLTYWPLSTASPEPFLSTFNEGLAAY
jgi:hypothetical protein